MNIKAHNNSGFTLVEVTVALGVAAFSMISVFGLLPVGIVSNQNSLQQTSAANIQRAVAADLRSAPVGGTTGYSTSPLFGYQIPAAGQCATVSSTQTVYFTGTGNATGSMGVGPVTNSSSSVSLYRVTVTFIPPSAAGQRTATAAHILVTWPALADPNPAAQPANYCGFHETTTKLDRN